MGYQIKNKNLVKNFGVAARKRRLKMKVSQEKFAEIAGIHRTYVSKIELGEIDVGLSMVFRLAQTFAISVATLLRDVEIKK